jgi:hypothetical protein
MAPKPKQTSGFVFATFLAVTALAITTWAVVSQAHSGLAVPTAVYRSALFLVY